MIKLNFNHSKKISDSINKLILIIIFFIPFRQAYSQETLIDSSVSEKIIDASSNKIQDSEVVENPDSTTNSESNVNSDPTSKSDTATTSETTEMTSPIFRREDPFEPPKSFLRAAPQSVTSDSSNKNASDLEKYDVSDFTLVGILWNVKKPKALVKIPNGTVHVVFKKTKLGLYGGYVSDFTEGAVEVVEYLVNEENGKREKDIRFIEFKKNLKKTSANTPADLQRSLKSDLSNSQESTETDLNKTDQGEQ